MVPHRPFVPPSAEGSVTAPKPSRKTKADSDASTLQGSSSGAPFNAMPNAAEQKRLAQVPGTIFHMVERQRSQVQLPQGSSVMINGNFVSSTLKCSNSAPCTESEVASTPPVSSGPGDLAGPASASGSTESVSQHELKGDQASSDKPLSEPQSAKANDKKRSSRAA